MPEGKYREWYLDGTRRLVIPYKNGKEDGTWIQWYSNGKKELTIGFVNGVAWGKARFWYEDGNLKIEGEIISETESGGFILRDRGGNKRYYEFK